jgi:hypothetical protein
LIFEIFVQTIGFLGIAFSIISVQFNTHGKIMLFKTASSLMFCLQYLLLGAFTGMVMDMIGTIRNIIFAYNVKKNKSNKWWIIFFSIITLVAGVLTLILTWNSLVARVTWLSGNNHQIALTIAVVISIVSIIAKLLSTIAYGFKNPHRIRMTNLPTCAGWIIYNFAVMSLAGIVNEMLSITSIIIAEIRFSALKRISKKKPTITPTENGSTINSKQSAD